MDSYDLMRSFVVRYNAANKQVNPPPKKFVFSYYAILEIVISLFGMMFSPHIYFMIRRTRLRPFANV